MSVQVLINAAGNNVSVDLAEHKTRAENSRHETTAVAWFFSSHLFVFLSRFLMFSLWKTKQAWVDRFVTCFRPLLRLFFFTGSVPLWRLTAETAVAVLLWENSVAHSLVTQSLVIIIFLTAIFLRQNFLVSGKKFLFDQISKTTSTTWEGIQVMNKLHIKLQHQK